MSLLNRCHRCQTEILYTVCTQSEKDLHLLEGLYRDLRCESWAAEIPVSPDFQTSDLELTCCKSLSILQSINQSTD